MAEVPVLGQAAARSRAAQTEVAPEEQAPQIVQASTAFVVAWINGEVIVTADLDAPITIDHYPTPDEILGAAAILIADRTAERTAGISAESTVGLIEHKQRESLAQMREAQAKAAGEQMLEAERAGKARR